MTTFTLRQVRASKTDEELLPHFFFCSKLFYKPSSSSQYHILKSYPKERHFTFKYIKYRKNGSGIAPLGYYTAYGFSYLYNGVYYHKELEEEVRKDKIHSFNALKNSEDAVYTNLDGIEDLYHKAIKNINSTKE